MFTKYSILAVPSYCPPVRLFGGDSENEGRVEIYYNNIWGTVCNTYWGSSDSDTVCRQLGYTGSTQNYHFTFFGNVNSPIWMDRVSCGTLDACLGKCSFTGFGNNRCQHSQDIFVNCSGTRDSDKLGNEQS